MKLFSDIFKQQAGLLSVFSIPYRYILIKSPKHLQQHYNKLIRKMNYSNFDNPEKWVRERFPVKQDKLGRNYVFKITQSRICPDPANIDKYPLVNGIFRVPVSQCNTCVHCSRYSKRKRYCKLHKDSNKDLIKNLWSDTRDRCKEVFGLDIGARLEQEEIR